MIELVSSTVTRSADEQRAMENFSRNGKIRNVSRCVAPPTSPCRGVPQPPRAAPGWLGCRSWLTRVISSLIYSFRQMIGQLLLKVILISTPIFQLFGICIPFLFSSPNSWCSQESWKKDKKMENKENDNRVAVQYRSEQTWHFAPFPPFLWLCEQEIWTYLHVWTPRLIREHGLLHSISARHMLSIKQLCFLCCCHWPPLMEGLHLHTGNPGACKNLFAYASRSRGLWRITKSRLERKWRHLHKSAC